MNRIAYSSSFCLLGLALVSGCAAEPTCEELQNCLIPRPDASDGGGDADAPGLADRDGTAPTEPEADSPTPPPDADADAGSPTPDGDAPAQPPDADAGSTPPDADAAVCTPNPTPTHCTANTPQFCNTSGQWQNVSTGACPGASTCTNGTCVCAATMCASGCANLDADGHNCGTCGHDCLGGGCQGGKCQPVVLASGQDYPQALAIDASNIYWVNAGAQANSGAVLQLEVNGSSSPIPLATSQPSPGGIAVDATSVYWSVGTDAQGNPSSGEIRSIAIGGGTFVSLARGQDSPGPIARDSSSVYWANTGMNSPAVRRVLKGGGSPPLDVRTGIYPEARGLTVDANNVYLTISFMSIRRAERIPLNGSSDFVIGTGGPGGIAVDGTSVYWADAGTNSIRKASITAVDATTATDLATNQSAPVGVAIDAMGIYWSNLGNGTIMKLAPGQTVPVVLAQGQNKPTAIVVDPSTIYWVNDVAAGSVMKLAK